MPTVALACALLVALTAVLHYEVLRGLNSWLPSLKIPDRFKLLIVIVAAFFAHAVEMLLYEWSASGSRRPMTTNKTGKAPSDEFTKYERVRPNPSFHPTCYGWLRQPLHASKLKRGRATVTRRRTQCDQLTG